MADDRDHADVSPSSSPRASISTAEQSRNDAGAAQNGSTPHSNSHPTPTQAHSQSTEALVSLPPTGAESVTVEAPDPDTGINGPRRRVTVRRDDTLPQRQSTVLQKSNGNANTAPASGQWRGNYTFIRMLRCWLLELFAIFLAAVVVVILVVLLVYYHDRNVRAWNHEWAINSVFAFLTAIMEASVAFAIGSCLGQLRWLWYTTSHDKMELKWMDRLTNAKSAPGAFRFAVGNAKTAYRHTAFWGAALIMALLGVGVFTQQVITIRGQEREVYNNDGVSPATIPITHTYEDEWQYGATGATPGDQMPRIQTIAAIESGFLLPSSGLSIDESLIDTVSCPSGNCTWGLYSTLSLCWSCTDISNQILCRDAYQDPSSCPKGERTRLPDNSVSLDYNTGVVNITSDDQYPKYSNYTNPGPLVARMLGLGYWTKPAFATECVLTWCVATYNATMESNVFTQSHGKFWTNTTAPHTYYGSDWYIHLNPDECYENGVLKQNCTFGVDSLSHRALQNFLINGSVSTNSTGFLRGSAEVPDSSNNGTNWINEGLAATAVISPCTNYGDCNNIPFYQQFDLSFAWMTTYMSNNIREIAGGYTHGTETRFDTYFHVRWGWLAYPIAIVLIALGFLIVTMWKSRFSMPWKSSVTALLLHGIPDEDRKQSTLALDNPVEMKEAENWIVTLQDHQGTRTFKVKNNGIKKSTYHVGGATEGAAEVGIAVLGALEGANLN